MLISFLFARPILVVFGASSNALTYLIPYIMIYLIGTIPSMISIGMNPFINAQGYSTIGNAFFAIGVVANLLLDPLFIFFLGFGVTGADCHHTSQDFIRGFLYCFSLPEIRIKVRFLRKNEISQCTAYAKDIVKVLALPRLYHRADKQSGNDLLLTMYSLSRVAIFISLL